MGANSKIEWTDNTFNPWWGCTRITSVRINHRSACDHCYAADLDKRYGFHNWEGERRFFGEKHWNEPLKWNREAEKTGKIQRVFCASMCDVFEKLPDFEQNGRTLDTERARLWKLIEATPYLDWLLLTKRPQFMIEMTPEHWNTKEWPLNTVALTTVESSDYLWRIDKLCQVKCRRRGVSMEPLFSSVDLSEYLNLQSYGHRYSSLQWIITGGESGPKAQPSHPDWFRSLRDQCEAADICFHFKQWGEYGPVEPDHRPCVVKIAGEEVVGMARIGKKVAGRMLDNCEYSDYPPRPGKTLDDYAFASHIPNYPAQEASQE